MSLFLLPFLRKRPLVWEVRKPWHSILQRARHPGIVARLGGMVAGWKEAAGCYLPQVSDMPWYGNWDNSQLVCVAKLCHKRDVQLGEDTCAGGRNAFSGKQWDLFQDSRHS